MFINDLPVDCYTLLSQPGAPRHNEVSQDRWPDALVTFPNRTRGHWYLHYYQASLDLLALVDLLALHFPQVS